MATTPGYDRLNLGFHRSGNEAMLNLDFQKKLATGSGNEAMLKPRDAIFHSPLGF